MIDSAKVIEIIKSFKYGDEPKPPKVYYRMKLDGRFITTVSGKTMWNRIGHAKNALRNHLQWALIHDYNAIEEYYHYLLNNRIVFVELEV